MKEQAIVEIVLSNGDKAGKTINDLTAQSVKLARELKKLPEDSEEFVKKSADFQKISGRIKGMKEEAFGYKKAQEDARKELDQFVPYNGRLTQFVNTYKSLQAGVMGYVRSLGIAKTAMAATGIGALVLVLGSLISYLTTTQEGMDKVTRVTRPLKAIFEVLKGVVQELGGKVFSTLAKAITSPKQAFIDLANVIQENVINRFKALGLIGPAIMKIFSKDWKQGLKDLGDAVIQSGTGIEGASDKLMNAGKAVGEKIKEGVESGANLGELDIGISKMENAMIADRARLNKEFAESRELARDMTVSEKERAEAAQRAIKIQDELLGKEQAIIDKKIERMEIEHGLNDTSRADDAELQQLIADRYKFEEEAANKRKSARQLLTGIERKADAEASKAIAERAKQEEAALAEKQKREEEFRQKTIEADKALADLRIALISDESERKIKELELAYERDLAAFQGTEDQKAEYALLRADQLINDLDAIDDEQAKKRQERNAQRMAEEEEAEKLRIETAFYNAITSEEEKEQALYELRRHYMELRLEAVRQSAGEESLEYKRLFAEIAKLDHEQTQQKIENAEKVAAQKKQMEQMTFQAANATFSGIVELLQLEEGARKKNFGLIKAMNTAQILANLPNEISGYWASMASSGPAGWLVAGLQTATAMVRAGKAVSQVNAQKMARGGVIFGPSHSQGGIPANTPNGMVEIEGQEIILTKGVYQSPMLRAAASALNVMGGGRAFAAGGIPASPNMQSTASNSPAFVTWEQFQMLVEEIRAWPRQLTVTNNLQDTKRGIEVLNSLQREVDV